MAYYSWNSGDEPVQEVTAGRVPSAVGAYFGWNSSHEPVVPINGLGTTPEAELADEAIRARIDGRPPLMVAGEWAIERGDTLWEDTPKDAALTLLPLTDRDLNEGKRAAFGHEVQAVGILRRTPARLTEQELRLAGTPYELGMSLAIYSLADEKRVAVPYFLTIATLRSAVDEEGGAGSLERAAASLGGRLVYIVSLRKPEGARNPGARFMEVFRRIGLSSAEPAPSAPHTEKSLIAPTAVSLVPWFIGGSLVAVGAWIALRKATG